MTLRKNVNFFKRNRSDLVLKHLKIAHLDQLPQVLLGKLSVARSESSSSRWWWVTIILWCQYRLCVVQIIPVMVIIIGIIYWAFTSMTAVGGHFTWIFLIFRVIPRSSCYNDCSKAEKRKLRKVKSFLQDRTANDQKIWDLQPAYLAPHQICVPNIYVTHI